MPASDWNEKGNKESVSLNRFNEDLLRRAGGFWPAPPVISEPRTQLPWNDRRAEARTLVTRVFGDQPFVWKDPRNCILLPFWQAVTAPPLAALFVYRDPFEVAASLKARNGLVITHGLALWERYVRSAAANLDGVPTLVLDFDRVLEEPEALRSELIEFLRTVGLDVDDNVAHSSDPSVDGRLRHHTKPRQPSSGIYQTQRHVVDVLDQSRGSHFPWSAPDLGDEPEWVEDVFTIWRRYKVERQQHRPSSSPVVRASNFIRRAGRQFSGGDSTAERP